MHPEIVLFDEPTSALDPELVGDVLDVMKRLSNTGITMVVVTHEIGFAREVADTVVFMAEGRIVETGPPEIVLTNPVNARTQEPFLVCCSLAVHLDRVCCTLHVTTGASR
ncbi:ABC-type polar amino acid transport system ATPase subunit [Rhodococcus sp. 27YEA15]